MEWRNKQQSRDRVGARSAPFGVLVSLKSRVRAAAKTHYSLYFDYISFLHPFGQDVYIVQQRGIGKAISCIGKQFTASTHVCTVQTVEVDVIFFVKK